MRRLIVNADDFGLTVGVNRGILESHRNGVVTSTTVMACGDGFADAAALPAQAPKLSVGCHVVLVDGRPVLNPAQVQSLMANSGACFRESLAAFAGRAAMGQIDSGQIEAEVTAQIQKLQSAGIAVSHLDSHKHTHMFPVVLKGLLRAAKECGVRAMRNPFEPLVFTSLGRWKRRFQLRLLRLYRARFQNALAEAGVATPDGCVGIAVTGGLTAAAFRQLLENLPEGTWEFVSHPGYCDPDLDGVKTRLRKSRENELAILTSPEVKALISQEQIQLITYRDVS